MAKARMKRGVRITDGAFLEIELDGVVWRITRMNSGLVKFECIENGEVYEISDPPAGIQRIWELCEEPAQGEGPH